MDMIGDIVGGAADSVTGGLFSLVRSGVEEFASQIGNGQQMLEDLVRAPIQGMIQEVGNGSVWKGQGATAFAEECNQIFLPALQAVDDGLGTMTRSTIEAADIMQAADSVAARKFQDLEEEFKNIYRE